ncbi:MAG: ATP-binding cassette domain-containing protein [Planctomycetota bacterium]|nr:MAG: ATP-binding cassette domain-containing protein [Planctomycetota bacterium]
MPVVTVRQLVKEYRVHRKPEGLLASVRALFRRRYQRIRAVDGISFDIEEGEMVGFLGPNGAGKTTTLKVLSGLIYPTSGTAEVLGFVPWQRRNAYRRRFALLMGQKNQLWWDLPAMESFHLHKEIYAIPKRRFREVLDELSTLLEVRDLLHQPVRELSLGERMKMELIAALLHSPRVLFLDEPTIGLDVVAQMSIRQCLKAYNREKRITVLLTSHYMQDIEALCDRVLIIHHGRLIHDGPLARVLDRFGGYKLLKVRFGNGHVPERLDSIGEVVELDPPTVTFHLPRDEVPERASRLLQRFAVEDISVEDPPIAEVIGRVFRDADDRPSGERVP